MAAPRSKRWLRSALRFEGEKEKSPQDFPPLTPSSSLQSEQRRDPRQLRSPPPLFQFEQRAGLRGCFLNDRRIFRADWLLLLLTKTPTPVTSLIPAVPSPPSPPSLDRHLPIRCSSSTPLPSSTCATPPAARSAPPTGACLLPDGAALTNIVFRGTVFGPSPSSPKVASFSSRGVNYRAPKILKLDMIAPGVNILTGWTAAVGPTDLDIDSWCVTFNIISSRCHVFFSQISCCFQVSYHLYNPSKGKFYQSRWRSVKSCWSCLMGRASCWGVSHRVGKDPGIYASFGSATET